MKVDLITRIVEKSESNEIGPINTGELLMLTIGTTTTVGTVTSARKLECELSLKRPISAPVNAKISISRRIGSRWRLIGIGTLLR
jgi:translation initiation factor 2 subunit 3